MVVLSKKEIGFFSFDSLFRKRLNRKKSVFLEGYSFLLREDTLLEGLQPPQRGWSFFPLSKMAVKHSGTFIPVHLKVKANICMFYMYYILYKRNHYCNYFIDSLDNQALPKGKLKPGTDFGNIYKLLLDGENHECHEKNSCSFEFLSL